MALELCHPRASDLSPCSSIALRVPLSSNTSFAVFWPEHKLLLSLPRVSSSSGTLLSFHTLGSGLERVGFGDQNNRQLLQSCHL